MGSRLPTFARFHSPNNRRVNQMQGKLHFSIALMNSESHFTATQVFSHRSYSINPLNHLKEKAESSLEKRACVLASCHPIRNQFTSSTYSYCKSHF